MFFVFFETADGGGGPRVKYTFCVGGWLDVGNLGM